MALTQDEIREVTELLVRCHIDLNQGMRSSLDSQYTDARKNFNDALGSLQKIIEKVHD